MRVINQYNETITNYDLTKGKLIKGKMKHKNGEMEEVQIYMLNKSMLKKEISIPSQIKQLKKQLENSDYKIIKCSECQLLGEPMPYDVVTLHAERQAIRDKINELEAQLCQS